MDSEGLRTVSDFISWFLKQESMEESILLEKMQSFGFSEDEVRREAQEMVWSKKICVGNDRRLSLG